MMPPSTARIRLSFLALTIGVLIAACAQAPVTPPAGVQVFVTPNVETLEPGDSATFTATVSGTADTSVAWTATCGEVTSAGASQVVYTAPATETQCILTATSLAHPTASGSATITVAVQVPEVQAGTDPDAPVAEVDLAPGATMVFRVTIPSGGRGPGQRLVIEADDDEGFRQLDLVLLGPDGTTATASTSGTAYFRPGRLGLGEGFVGTSATTAAATRAAEADGRVDRAVAVVRECVGPCIARPAPGGLTHVYVELTNVGTSAVSVPFYAYTQPFIDEGEPSGSPAQAVQIGVGEFHRGAIEVLGDEDWYLFTTAGTVSLDERAGYDVSLAMDIFDGATLVTTIRAGQSAFVLAGDHGVVYSESPTRATVYGFYFVSLE